ncbi:hypothetical protein KFE25_013631 [Diacronema lutheri]|uniref:Cilia-and flagella-associated protein 96 n=1 Tax=Diacronema lutheri TaxID=2081491 RepID=A0A8J6CI87_DIALT|nr:hypothetical protein KFE25_013631 [Diacronema lutheri]
MVMQVPDIKNTMQTHGTFSTPSVLGAGDPFDKKGGSADLRLRGKPNFIGGPVPNNPHKGFQRLYEGEKWQSEFERSRKFSVEQKKKNLTDHGFKYSSPNKKSSGLGNYYGAIGPKHRHEGEHEGAGKGEKPPLVVPEPRQMMTMPPKKGRFNTPGISFGAPQPRGMPHVLGKEFEYKSDPYNLARKLEMETRAKSKKLRQPQPFRAMAHSLDYFDATKSGVSSKVYEPVAMPEKKAPPPPAPRVADKPFYPAKPPKEGIYGTINKFPEHMEDPETVRWKAEQEKKKRESNMTPWKYEAWGKTAPTRSILFHHPGISTLS